MVISHAWHTGVLPGIYQVTLDNLAKKLGIRPGDLICLLDPSVKAERVIREATPDGVTFFKRLEGRSFDLILFWPEQIAGLEERFAVYQSCIRPDGAVWAVMPKKKYAPLQGISFTWEQLQAAALATDLVDNKIAAITAEEYGTRFVIRKERRMNYGKPA